jgi:hypothetical protein
MAKQTHGRNTRLGRRKLAAAKAIRKHERKTEVPMAPLPKAPQLEPSRQLLPIVDY